MTTSPPRDLTVAGYLARRLHAAGVGHVFGVPGDFTLVLNDALHATGLLEWVGTANELGAAYAADGYARRRGLGAVVTTYGVGELSCLGAVAGAYAEQVPLLQVTGAPPTSAASAGTLLHHTLGDGDFGHFARAYAEVTVAARTLPADDPAGAIDDVLDAVLTNLRPGYLSIPVDLVDAPVDPARLAAPVGPPSSDPQALAAFTDAARDLLRLGTPAVVVGHLVQRLRAEPGLRALVEAGDLSVVDVLSGRAALDTGHPAHRGLYLGAMGAAGPRRVVDAAPVLVEVGVLWSDVVAGFFTRRDDPARTIALGVTSATVAGRTFDGVRLSDALTVLTELITPTRPSTWLPAPTSGPADGTAAEPARISPPPDDDRPLTQADLWAQVQAWLPPGCTLVTDIGTSFWGAVDLDLPPDTVLVAQPVWSAIGYALPATLGAALAEPDRRAVLVTGEGAAMMTAAELGGLARRAPGAVLIVIDNGGYTIERTLRSPQATHHDVAAWDWTAVATAMAPTAPPLVARVTTAGQLRDALTEAGQEKDRLSVVQVVTGPHDVPPLLAALAATVQQSSRGSEDAS